MSFFPPFNRSGVGCKWEKDVITESIISLLLLKFASKRFPHDCAAYHGGMDASRRSTRQRLLSDAGRSVGQLDARCSAFHQISGTKQLDLPW